MFEILLKQKGCGEEFVNITMEAAEELGSRVVKSASAIGRKVVLRTAYLPVFVEDTAQVP